MTSRFSNLYGFEGVPFPTAPKSTKSELSLIHIGVVLWGCVISLVCCGLTIIDSKFELSNSTKRKPLSDRTINDNDTDAAAICLIFRSVTS